MKNKNKQKGFFGGFNEVLKQNGFEGTANEYALKKMRHGILLAVFLLAGSALLERDLIEQLLAFTLGLAFPVLTGFFYNYYFFDYKRRKMEQAMPDMLSQASLFPKGTTLSQIINYFSKSTYPFLSDEFKKCRVEIKKGAAPELALANFKKRTKSKIISRTVNLLTSGIKSGSDAKSVFRESAEDLIETAGIIKERNASLVIEKYTLLFAGGIIVPLALGMVAGIIQQFDFSIISEIGLGADAAQKKELLQATLLASQIYIIEYAFMASFFVAFQENDPKKTIIYAAVLVPLSIVAFLLFQWN